MEAGNLFIEQTVLPYVLIIITTIVFCMVVGAVAGSTIKSYVVGKAVTTAAAILPSSALPMPSSLSAYSSSSSSKINSNSSSSNNNNSSSCCNSNSSNSSSSISSSKSDISDISDSRKSTRGHVALLASEAAIGDDLYLNIKPARIPTHISVIMDGNRRYGREHHSDPIQGHMKGGQVLIDFVNWCITDGVEILTVYAFSSENWNRDPAEVEALMSIIIKYAEKMREESISKNVKVRVISTEKDRLSDAVRDSIEKLEETSKNCNGLLVNICLSYGSRSEIVGACKQISQSVKEGSIGVEQIDEALFGKSLLLGDCSYPDIMIRTSGEVRMSNFLLWQLAYSELFFVEKFWPEFTFLDFRRILWSYSNRERRFGS